MKKYLVMVYDLEINDILLYCVRVGTVREAKALVLLEYKQSWGVERVPELKAIELKDSDVQHVQYVGKAETYRLPVPVPVRVDNHTPAVEWA